MTGKKILIIAGPNGAGKTAFATEFLPNEADCPQFVNVDLIAAGLPFAIAAVKASRLMLEAALAELEKKGESVDAWALYDNSGAEPVLMDWREKP